jgi:hypothetical protein
VRRSVFVKIRKKMRRIFLFIIAVLIIIVLTGVGYRWYYTQPIEILALNTPIPAVIRQLPRRNQEVIQYIEIQGKALAPSYTEIVCTDYVINVLSHFYPLSKTEKKAIQIITNEDLYDLIINEKPIIKGIYTALIQGGKGTPIAEEDVQAGDFVQFWNILGNHCYGHCGIVKSIDEQMLTLYSSHPMTDGFGIHTFRFPDRAYFVRLK